MHIEADNDPSHEVSDGLKLRAALAEFVRSHPAITVFMAAFGTRAIVVAILAVTVGGLGVFPDDAFYNEMAIDAASGQTHHWNDFTEGLYWRTATFVVPLTFIYTVIGPIPWLGQLLVALLGAATAGLATRLGIEAGLGTGWALFAGAVVAFLPSQVLFSSLTLKDAAVWALLAGLAVVVAIAGRAGRKRLIWLLITMVVLLLLMRYLRTHTLVVGLWGVALAAWFGNQRERLLRGVAALLILLALPLAFGLGPAGLDLITSAGSLEARRAANAANADTAFIPTGEELAEGSGRSDNDGSATAGDGSSAQGANVSEGIDQEGATNAGETGRVNRDLLHLPYGVAVMLAAPFPWWGEGNPRVQMAQFAMILWYPIVLFAIVGLFFVWRYRRAMAFPVLVGSGTLLVYSLVEGNFGTAYRHRGEFVWVVALLAAIGLKHTVDWIRGRRTTRT